MKRIAALLLALSLHAVAQQGLHMENPLSSLTRAQIKSLETQSQQFSHAARPAVALAAKSTLIIGYRGHRVAFGTAVYSPALSKNVILTKWSEINHYYNRLIVTTSQGKYGQATLIGIYPEHDLAVLGTELKLTPINLTAQSSPELGDFIALASPDGSVRSLGVISVKARSLRDTDKAYLGVLMNFNSSNQYGSPLTRVVPDSPAAMAGLEAGDIVTSINRKSIKGSNELRNILQKLVPGSMIPINYRRDNHAFSTHVRLGSRPAGSDPSRVSRERMAQMQRMGAVPNRVRYDFPNVIQSDMAIQLDDTPDDPRDDLTNECGGPVTDLNGKMVGIVIARGSRIKTFIIPTQAIKDLLHTRPHTLQNTYSTQRNNSRSQTARYSKPRRNSRTEKVPPRAIPVDE